MGASSAGFVVAAPPVARDRVPVVREPGTGMAFCLRAFFRARLVPPWHRKGEDAVSALPEETARLAPGGAA